MPAAVAIPAAIGGVASLGSALLGGHAASQAGKQQAAGAANASQIMANGVSNANPILGQAAAGAGQQVSVAAGNAGAGVASAADYANGQLNPYVGMGQSAVSQLGDFMGPDGAGNHAFTAADMAAYDPGYQFRLEQGMKALNNSMAAHGMTDSGAALKAAARYGQDYSSNEFQNAFARNEQQTNDRFSRLSTLMGAGMSAANTSGQNELGSAQYGGNAGMAAAQYGGNAGMWAGGQQASNIMGGAQYQGNAAMGVGNAQAAGTMGAANAWGQGLGGVANSAISAYQMNNLFGKNGTMKSAGSR
jgi:hypothetical protein